MYYNQIDSFRFFSVVLVLIAHWLCGVKAIENLRLGAIGVEFFFVASGFLITVQLFNYKKLLDERRATFRKVLYTFYVRRFLRIFPLYYFVLTLATAFNQGEIRDAAVYNFGYASNFFFIKVQHWTATFSHFWSLSVEEHFYLVWPLLVLTLRRKYLPYLFSFLILFSIVFRYDTFTSDWNFVKVYAHTFSCLDLFMLGGFLAFLYEEKKEIFHKIFQHQSFRYIVLLSFILLYGIFVLNPEMVTFNWVFQRFFQGIVFAVVIGFLVTGINGKAGQLLSNKHLVHLGKLSYGIYLIHNFVPGILLPIKELQLSEPLEFTIYFITTLLIAGLLHRIIEKPIRKLNKHFELKREKKKEVVLRVSEIHTKLHVPIKVFPN